MKLERTQGGCTNRKTPKWSIQRMEEDKKEDESPGGDYAAEGRLDSPAVAQPLCPTLVEYIGKLLGMFHAGHILAGHVGEGGWRLRISHARLSTTVAFQVGVILGQDKARATR